jgi:hypothetical protein
LTFLPPHLHVSVVTIYTNSRIIHLQGWTILSFFLE